MNYSSIGKCHGLGARDHGPWLWSVHRELMAALTRTLLELTLLCATLPQNSTRKLLEEEQDGGNLTTVSDGDGVVGNWLVTRKNGDGRAELDGGVLRTLRKRVKRGNGCSTEWRGHNTLL
jgi:hypothetical protein